MDNFYLKFHKGSKQPFYKVKSLDFFKSKSLYDDYKKGYKDFDEDLLKNLFLRQLLHVQTVCDGFPKRIILDTNSDILEKFKESYDGVDDFRTEGRLAIGLGNTSVFETSITLHHIYGFPYIPASSIKGILRSWIIQEYFSKNDNDKNSLINAESNALNNKVFCLLFGCQKDKKTVVIENRQPQFKNTNNDSKKSYQTISEPTKLAKDHIGNIVFFDAYPIKSPQIEVDIMNPHYSEYYKDGSSTPPADWQNPIPIFFLTVKKTPFQFLFGYRKNIVEEEFNYLQKIKLEHPTVPEMTKEGTAIEVLSSLLREALDENGIGAKTAVDYGRMTSLNEEKQRKKEAERKRLETTKLEQEKEQKRIAEQKRINEEIAAQEKAELEDLKRRQDENKAKREQEQKLIRESGLRDKLVGISNFEEGKAIISEFKGLLNEIPASEYPYVKTFLQNTYQTVTSNKERKKWSNFKKNPWKLIATWINRDTAQEWFNEIIS
jgi:CRISPR type III-B/RAMP module RAMP protein Cmr6